MYIVAYVYIYIYIDVYSHNIVLYCINAMSHSVPNPMSQWQVHMLRDAIKADLLELQEERFKTFQQSVAKVRFVRAPFVACVFFVGRYPWGHLHVMSMFHGKEIHHVTGKIHDFDWAMASIAMLNYQRVPTLVI